MGWSRPSCGVPGLLSGRAVGVSPARECRRSEHPGGESPWRPLVLSRRAVAGGIAVLGHPPRPGHRLRQGLSCGRAGRPLGVDAAFVLVVAHPWLAALPGNHPRRYSRRLSSVAVDRGDRLFPGTDVLGSMIRLVRVRWLLGAVASRARGEGL